MPCETDALRKVPLFAKLDEEELGILADQVRIRTFGAQHRIYKIGAPAEHAYVLLAGSVRVTTVDEDQQEVVVNEPAPVNSSALLPCWSRPCTRQTPRPRATRSASRWTATTSSCSSTAGRARPWTCSPCSDASFTGFSR
jgi:CRP-like cAMP-binding protein